MPVAAQAHRISWMIAVFSIIPMIVIAGVGFAVMKAAKVAGSSITRYEASGSPLLSDINGDGHVDIVGRTSVYDNDGSFLRYYLTAYDGLGGEELWKSASIGTSEELPFGKLALHAGVIVSSNGRGILTGYAIESGATLWQVSMGEKLLSLCAMAPKSLALNLNDKTWKLVALADGTLSAMTNRPGNCEEVASYEKYGQLGIHLESVERGKAKREIFTSEAREREATAESHRKLQAVAQDKEASRFERKAASDALAAAGDQRREKTAQLTKQLELDFLDVRSLKLPGIRIVDSIKLQETGLYVALAHKAPGTRIPMLAILDIKAGVPEVRWSSELPLEDPLTYKEGAPELVAFNQTLVSSSYSPRDSSRLSRLALFQRSDGKRVWDVALSENLSLESIDMSEQRIYVSQNGRLEAYDIASGDIVFTLK